MVIVTGLRPAHGEARGSTCVGNPAQGNKQELRQAALLFHEGVAMFYVEIQNDQNLSAQATCTHDTKCGVKGSKWMSIASYGIVSSCRLPLPMSLFLGMFRGDHADPTLERDDRPFAGCPELGAIQCHTSGDPSCLGPRSTLLQTNTSFHGSNVHKQINNDAQ